MKINRFQVGFNLIELMIVVAIMGILVAVAVPAYTDQVRKTRRTEAKKELMQLAQAQERFLTNCGVFAPSIAGSQADCSGLGGPSTTRTTEHSTYEITMGNSTATTWTLTATPIGQQASDLKCGNLTFTHLGTKNRTGTAPLNECW